MSYIYQLKGKIDSSNAKELEDELLKLKEQQGDIQIDAKELIYISSAGLRVLLKIRKMQEVLSIINVSSEVYEIMETTGFTELMDVKKALKQVSIDGLEVMGNGATGIVYRMDEDTIIKVFNENTALPLIENERNFAKNALLNGVSTAISYDLVQVGNRYGVIYEMLKAKDLTQCIYDNYEKVDNYIIKMTDLMKKMHSIEVDTSKYADTKNSQYNAFSILVKKGALTEEEADIYRKVYSCIPESKTFLHGDCHTGNIMLQDGELFFIDMMTCGFGHPIFDLTSMYILYQKHKFYPEDPTRSTNLKNFTFEQCDYIWNKFITSYLETDNEEIIKTATIQIVTIMCIKMSFAFIFVPSMYSEAKFNYMKNKVIEFSKLFKPEFDFYPIKK